MILTNNVKMALTSIKGSRARSFLTMLGIIIGVSSVVTIVSLGQGVKKQVLGEISRKGDNLLTIRPGQAIQKDSKGHVKGLNIAALIGASTLSEKDLKTITDTNNVSAVAPIAVVAATPTVDGQQPFPNGVVIASTPNLPEVLNHKVKSGSFFDTSEVSRNVAVIGSDTAQILFQDESPIGRVINIRGQEFIVRGVMEKFNQAGIDFSYNYNSAIFIPTEVAKKLSNDVLEVREIAVRVNNTNSIDNTFNSIRDALIVNHAGQEDFSIFRQGDVLSLTSQVLGILTSFVAAIAGISLLVGGIGIMNIMLVSVTERTREIGIRKSIGATNRQILIQFLIEAMALSIVGGILGVLLATAGSAAIAVLTDIQPAFDPVVIIVALVISTSIGVLFGITPALKAARKDPIDALRHD